MAFTRLVKTDHLLGAGGENDIQRAIKQAIKSIAAELNLIDPRPLTTDSLLLIADR